MVCWSDLIKVFHLKQIIPGGLKIMPFLGLKSPLGRLDKYRVKMITTFCRSDHKKVIFVLIILSEMGAEIL